MTAVRPATVADADAIAAIDPTWSASDLAATLAAPATLAWVLVDDGAVIGHVLASAAEDEGEIVLIAVDPKRRRAGHGARLLSIAHDAWRARGVTRAFLEVRADNTAARALYARSGWSAAGVRRGYYRDGVDAVRMTWSA